MCATPSHSGVGLSRFRRLRVPRRARSDIYQYGTSTVTPGSHSLLERGTGEWPADLRTSHAAWQDGLRR